MSTSAPTVPAAELAALPTPSRELELERATQSGPAQALLAAHVPLSLLLDLAQPGGPRSAELLAGEPGDAAWLR